MERTGSSERRGGRRGAGLGAAVVAATGLVAVAGLVAAATVAGGPGDGGRAGVEATVAGSPRAPLETARRAPPETAEVAARADTPEVAEPFDEDLLERALERAASLGPLSSLLVARDGELLVERYYRGMRADRAVNVKSVSKTLLSPLVGIALERGLLAGVEQPLSELLPDYYERLERRDRSSARKREVTLHHVLSMTAGIESTSFRNYGPWVSSSDWVWDQLRRPSVCAPGRCFEYSTGNTHLISAILQRVTGEDLRTFAREAFFGPLGIPVHAWDRDPQGRYLGGNNMAMRPRDLLAFGQTFLDGGRHEGRRLVPEWWIEASWRPVATSPWNGHRYGYLWWMEDWGGERAYFAWGYGGQYVVLVPRLDLVAVVTSDLGGRRRGHTRRLRDFFDDYLVPAFAVAGGTPAAAGGRDGRVPSAAGGRADGGRAPTAALP